MTANVALAGPLEDDLGAELGRLVAAGVGWPAIAAALGVSRQAVSQRHGRRQELVRTKKTR
ncbi:MAG: hypothetical protein ACRDV9_00475 [Acidimicrobiia bacterium]